MCVHRYLYIHIGCTVFLMQHITKRKRAFQLHFATNVILYYFQITQCSRSSASFSASSVERVYWSMSTDESSITHTLLRKKRKKRRHGSTDGTMVVIFAWAELTPWEKLAPSHHSLTLCLTRYLTLLLPHATPFTFCVFFLTHTFQFSPSFCEST